MKFFLEYNFLNCYQMVPFEKMTWPWKQRWRKGRWLRKHIKRKNMLSKIPLYLHKNIIFLRIKLIEQLYTIQPKSLKGLPSFSILCMQTPVNVSSLSSLIIYRVTCNFFLIFFESRIDHSNYYIIKLVVITQTCLLLFHIHLEIVTLKALYHPR